MSMFPMTVTIAKRVFAIISFYLLFCNFIYANLSLESSLLLSEANSTMMCPDYFSDELIEVNINADLKICALVPFAERDIYSIILDGSSYSPPVTQCDVDTILFYTYALLIGEGAQGPYSIDSWVCSSNQTHSAVVQDMAELVLMMQQWDPAGLWQHNPETFTISGGNPNGGYMNMQVTHVASGVEATIQTNFTPIARGTEIDFDTSVAGEYLLRIDGPDDCTDEVTIIINDPCADYTVEAGANQVTCAGNGLSLAASGAIAYTWSPLAGLSASNIPDPFVSPLTTTTYTVIGTNEIGCTASDDVLVTVNPAIVINVDENIPATCCTGGSLTLSATGGSGNYTFAWTDGIYSGTSVSDLPAGDYTISVTDDNGCAEINTFTVADDCICPEYFEDEIIYIEAGEAVDICVPVVLDDGDIYEVIYDGSAYAGPTSQCDVDSIIYYTYALLVNQGQSGPYRLDFWQCNGLILEDIVVQDMEQLTALMNTNDPSGNWQHNASNFTISGGNDVNGNTYGSILITHVPSNIQGVIQTNFTGIGTGTELTVTGTAPGEYDLTIFNRTLCCEDNVVIVIQPACELTVTADITNANCCGDNGTAILTATDGNGAITYTWQDAVSTTNTATDLAVGSYKVTVTDEYGCSQVGQVNIESDCETCDDVIAEETIYFQEGEDAHVCVPVGFSNSNIYDIILDGSDYTQPLTTCGIDTVVFYTYALLVNQGQSGPYRLDSWQCNNITIENIMVANMEELTAVLNANDPSGNWVHNPSTFTISGGNDTSDIVYGNIFITHIPSNVQAIIQTNYTEVPIGFDVDVPDAPGSYTVEIYNTELCCSDIVTVIVEGDFNPTSPDKDTVWYTTAYDTPLVNQCLPWQNVLNDDFASMTITDYPDFGTLTGLDDGDECLNYVPNTGFSGQDQFCVEVCDTDGVCGGIVVIVTVQESTVEPFQDTIYLTTAYETTLSNICLPWMDVFPAGFSGLGGCGLPDNGTLGNVTDGDACLDYIPNPGFTGLEEVCVLVCNEDGLCGTFILLITVLEPVIESFQDTIYLTTPFETTLENICLPWMNAFPSDLIGLSVCVQPTNGTLTNVIDGDECLDYTPNTGFIGQEEICVNACNADGFCGTFIVFITVLDPIVEPIGQDTVWYNTPYETPLNNQCMPWVKFFDEGFATIELCAEPENGTVMINTFDECLDYIPNPGFSGIDEFCVVICNEAGVCGTLIVFVTVGEPEEGTINPDYINETTPEGVPLEICLDTSELPGTVVLFGGCGDPSNGTILPTLGSTECFTYNPDAGFVGMDEFCVVICDDTALCDTTFVTINVTDVGECNIFDEDTITILDCSGEDVTLCIPVSLEEIVDYTITDNGAAYSGGFIGCDVDTMYTYLYMTLPGEGTTGPYTIVSWSENGDLHENASFDSLFNLVAIMNLWDPQGNWTLNEASMTISGGQNGAAYSELTILENATNTEVSLFFNTDLIANETQLTLSPGNHEMVFTNTAGCVDEVTIVIEENLLTGSSEMELFNPDCNGFTEVCIGLNAAAFPNATFNINGEPYTETLSQCDNGNGVALNLIGGSYAIEISDISSACIDTINVDIACIAPETITDTVYVSAMDTTCLDISELPGTLVSIENACPENSGELSVFEIVPETYCVIYQGVEVGEESACIVACDDLGYCDTTYILLSIIEREAVPILVTDVDTTLQNIPIDINVLANDTLDLIVDISITTQPEHGVATITPEGIATYTPNTDYCNNQIPDFFTYTVCDNTGNCLSEQVVVYVLCNEFIIFTGFSPNEDGINDVFYIQGIEAFDQPELRIYNRWGNQVYYSPKYRNTWNGSWKGNILPDGTYFYLLDDGEGNLYSGYLLLNR